MNLDYFKKLQDEGVNFTELEIVKDELLEEFQKKRDSNYPLNRLIPNVGQKDFKLTMKHMDDIKDEMYESSYRKQMKKKLIFVNKSPHEDPEYAHLTDSGMDLRAWIKNEDGSNYIELGPLQRAMIHTGIYFQIPDNCEIQVRPKSGRALKEGISIANCVGTVDMGYRNEVCVIVVNLSDKTVRIEDGQKIAQAVLAPVYIGGMVNLIKTDEISQETDRGLGGFGSTGIN